MAVIELNGNYYTLAQGQGGKAPITQSYVQRLSSAFRTVGVQQRSDDTSVNRYVSPGFPKGIGWQRAKRDSGRGVGGLKDSTCFTMKGPISNGKLHQSATVSDAAADHLRRFLEYDGVVVGLFAETYTDGSKTEGRHDEFGGADDTWNGGAVIDESGNNDYGWVPFDACVFKGSMVCVNISYQVDSRYDSRSSTGGAWGVQAADSSFPDGDWISDGEGRAAHDHNWTPARIMPYGDLLLYAFWAEATDGDKTVAVYSTTTVASGSTYVVECTGIPAPFGPRALVDWYNISGARSPVVVTTQGIYSVDVANNNFSQMYALDGHEHNGRWSVVANDGALYVGTGEGDIMRFSITANGILDVMTVGPPGDGLITDRQGHVNCMTKTPSEWLLVSYGGHSADHYASIFAIDTSVILTDEETGKKYMPWHSLYKHSVANLDITQIHYSALDDGVPRLHFSIEGTPDTLHFIEYPLDNPALNTSIQYQLTSTLQLPDDDLGDPQSNTLILQAMVDADDLAAGTGGSGGSGDNYIEFRYGIDGASDSGTSLGDFLSGQKTLSFGSGAGVSAKRLGINLLFDRDDSPNTETPKMHEFELQGQHIMLDKKAWDFTIDIAATARDFPPTVTSGQKAEEVIITNLETVAQSTTLVSFTTGRMTATKVRVPNDIPPQFSLTVEDSFLDDPGYRTGFVNIRLEEAI